MQNFNDKDLFGPNAVRKGNPSKNKTIIIICSVILSILIGFGCWLVIRGVITGTKAVLEYQPPITAPLAGWEQTEKDYNCTWWADNSDDSAQSLKQRFGVMNDGHDTQIAVFSCDYSNGKPAIYEVILMANMGFAPTTEEQQTGEVPDDTYVERGGFVPTTEWINNTLHHLADSITPDEIKAIHISDIVLIPAEGGGSGRWGLPETATGVPHTMATFNEMAGITIFGKDDWLQLDTFKQKFDTNQK